MSSLDVLAVVGGLISIVLAVASILIVRRVAVAAHEDATASRKPFDLAAFLHRQHAFSQHTFGPGQRTGAVIAHIRQELEEIEKDPHDPMEWADLMLLAFDGALRAGFTPEQICEGLSTKLGINEQRDWPDWRTVDTSKPINHVRT